MIQYQLTIPITHKMDQSSQTSVCDSRSTYHPSVCDSISAYHPYYSWDGLVQSDRHLWFHINLPSLLLMRWTSPVRQVSVISDILLAHLPMACMVAAANSLSLLVTYVWNASMGFCHLKDYGNGILCWFISTWFCAMYTVNWLLFVMYQFSPFSSVAAMTKLRTDEYEYTYYWL